MPHFQSPLSTIRVPGEWNPPPMGNVHPLSPPPHISSGSPERSSPNRAPTKRDTPFLEPSNYLLIFPVKGLPRFLSGPLRREVPISRIFLLHLSLKVPGKWASSPSTFPHQGPYGERSLISRTSGLFIHLYLSGSPIRSPPMKNGEEHSITLHRIPCGWKAYIQWDVAWFPMGII